MNRLTSIPLGAIHGAGVLEHACSHWQLENRRFRIRDGTFAEDQCRVRTGNAPAVLAHLRRRSLTLIRNRKLQAKPAPRSLGGQPLGR